MKKLKKTLIWLFIITVGAGWFPFVLYYQDAVYESDRAIYETEKNQWDSIQTYKTKLIEDSVFTYWISHNDTTIKTIKKITKTPTYGYVGYYRKNGKWSCEPETYHSSKLICEPMKEWVVTDSYVNGYQLDTTWTPGYKDRNEWLNKAHNIAHNEAMRQNQEFRPYDGHEYHWIASWYKSGKHELVYVLGVICTPLCGIYWFAAVYRFISALLSVFRRKY